MHRSALYPEPLAIGLSRAVPKHFVDRMTEDLMETTCDRSIRLLIPPGPEQDLALMNLQTIKACIRLARHRARSEQEAHRSV